MQGYVCNRHAACTDFTYQVYNDSVSCSSYMASTYTNIGKVIKGCNKGICAIMQVTSMKLNEGCQGNFAYALAANYIIIGTIIGSC